MATIKKFISGFKKFRDDYYIKNIEKFEQLVKHGQSPKTMVITCSDSRLPVATLLGAEPGEIFIVRNVANMVPKFDSGDQHLSTTAALEFAILNLKVNDIIVMGHSNCGGIQALMQHEPIVDKTSIDSWVSCYQDTRDYVREHYPDQDFRSQCQTCEKLAVIQALENIKSYPWVKPLIASKQLKLHGWYYEMTNCELYEIDPITLEVSLLTSQD